MLRTLSELTVDHASLSRRSNLKEWGGEVWYGGGEGRKERGRARERRRRRRRRRREGGGEEEEKERVSMYSLLPCCLRGNGDVLFSVGTPISLGAPELRVESMWKLRPVISASPATLKAMNFPTTDKSAL